MKIGFGGEANWNSHTESAAHRKNEAPKSLSSHSKLTSFFKRKSPESTATLKPSAPVTALAPSSLRNPFFLSSPLPASHVPNIDPTLITNVDGSPPPFIATPVTGEFSVRRSLLSELECVTASLPWSIPEGLATDALAQFSSNPVFELEDGQDAWEIADPALNRVIGFGKTVDEIAKIIRRGPLGMDGFCRWLRALVYELKVEESLLEGKVKRLIDAMITL